MTDRSEVAETTKPTAPPEEEPSSRWPGGVRFWIEEAGWSPRLAVVPVGAPVRVGRSHVAELPVSDPKVSRFHAVLWASGRSVTVADHHSRNGTFLRGVRVGEAVEVEPSAAIQIGDTVLVRAASSSRPARARWANVEPFAASPSMLALAARAGRALASPAPLWIEGESGSGRRLLGLAAHAGSGRAAGPLVRVDCATVAEWELLRAFTGATRAPGDDTASVGVVERAHGGTLLIEGFEQLSADGQAALVPLLRDAAQPAESRRSVDVRVIVTTRRALPGVPGRVLSVPPLRERPDDVASLARSFLDAAGDPRPLGRGVEAVLRAHAWPDNVRELRDAVGFARSIADGDRIELDDLPRAVVDPVVHDAEAIALRAAELETFERNAVVLALTATGSLPGAAAVLETSRSAMQHAIERLGLDARALGVRE